MKLKRSATSAIHSAIPVYKIILGKKWLSVIQIAGLVCFLSFWRQKSEFCDSSKLQSQLVESEILSLPHGLYCNLFVSLGSSYPVIQECFCSGFLLCFSDTVVAVNGIWILVETFMLQGRKPCSSFLGYDAGWLNKGRARKSFSCVLQEGISSPEMSHGATSSSSQVSWCLPMWLCH